MKGLITLYMTTLNRPKLLDRALLSVTEQVYKNVEVIVCNDASDFEYKDEYLQVINKYKDNFVGLTYLVNDSRMGACYSRNRAIMLAKGEYITGLDDDDIFDKDRLKLFFEFSYKNNYSFLCSNTKKISKLNIQLRDFDQSGRSISLEEMKNLNLVGNQIFIETDKIKEINGFDIEMPAWQDYELWFRLIKKFGPCYKLNACTMYLDDDVGRTRITTSSKAHQGYLKFIEKHKRDLSEKNIRSLKFMDMVNRKEKIPLLNELLIKDFKTYKTITKYQMTYRFRFIYKLYQALLK